MRLGSLFSGIGGLDLGLQAVLRAQTAWTCESEPFPRRVLAVQDPGVPSFGDVRQLREAPPVDLLCGGFPCTDISVAGKQRGLAGEASGLWFEMLRVIREGRPPVVVIENSSNLTNKGLDVVLEGLAGAGYAAEWQTLYAVGVGAWHRRARLFLVAYHEGPRLPVVFRREAGLVEEAFAANRGAGGLFDPRTEPPHRTTRMPPAQRRPHLKALGNAVVPPVAALVGRYIASAEDGYEPQGWSQASEPGASGAMRGGRLYDVPPVATLREVLDRHAAWLAAAPERGGQTPLEVLVLRLARGRDAVVPTPTAGDANASGSRNTGSAAHPGTSLSDWVRGDGGRGRKDVLLPSPVAEDSEHSVRVPVGADRLPGALAKALLPTPLSSGHRSGLVSCDVYERNARPLQEVVAGAGDRGGSFLCPRWVEWLMGFPAGWTQVP